MKTDLTEISEENRIEDSEDKDRWKDVVESTKVLNELQKLERRRITV